MSTGKTDRLVTVFKLRPEVKAMLEELTEKESMRLGTRLSRTKVIEMLIVQRLRDYAG